VKVFFRLMFVAGIACAIHWWLCFAWSARDERDVRMAVRGWDKIDVWPGRFDTKQQWSQYPHEVVQQYMEVLFAARDLRVYLHSAQRWALISAVLLVVTSSVGLRAVRKGKQIANNSAQPTAGG
jgi:hypothetical protein